MSVALTWERGSPSRRSPTSWVSPIVPIGACTRTSAAKLSSWAEGTGGSSISSWMCRPNFNSAPLIAGASDGIEFILGNLDLPVFDLVPSDVERRGHVEELRDPPDIARVVRALRRFPRPPQCLADDRSRTLDDDVKAVSVCHGAV